MPTSDGVMAADHGQPLELLTLDQKIFCELITESSAMRRALLTGGEVIL